MAEHELRNAVFLDRDGVLNVEGGYVVRLEDLRLLPGAANAVARLTGAGWDVVVFTNQAGVGRGYLTLETMHAIHGRLKEEIAAAGGAIAAVYACPHHPDDDCECRKPKPGLLHAAARERYYDLARCWAVGDSPRDIAAANAAGCRTILVLTGHTQSYDPDRFPEPQPDYVCPDLAAAAEWICTNPGPRQEIA